MDQKAFQTLLKNALKTELSPLLIGIRNDFDSLAETLKENHMQHGLGISLSAEAVKEMKHHDGKTPLRGTDYFTDQDIKDFLGAATPKRGTDYFTVKDIADFKTAVTPVKGVDYDDGKNGYTPIKGTDYFTDADIKEFLSRVTPKKGVDYFDGVTKTIVDYTDITGEEIRNKLEALTGGHRLSASAIKDFEKEVAKHVKNFQVPQSQDGGIGGSGGGGAQTPWASNINAAGFTLFGNNTSGGNLTLASTSHATKGKIIFGTASVYDEVNDYLGTGTLVPVAQHEIKSVALGVTPTQTAGIVLTTAGVAAVNSQQISGLARFRGSGWSTTSVAAMPLDFYLYCLPVQGAASPSGIFRIDFAANNGTITNIGALTTTGNFQISGQTVASFGSGQTGIYTASSSGLGIFNSNGSVSLGSVSNVGNWALTPTGLTGAQATTAWSLAQTLNTTGVVTVVKVTVTNTASNASSKVFDFIETTLGSLFSLSMTGQATLLGNLSLNSILAASILRVGATSQMQWNGRSNMFSPADGVIVLQNNASTDFGRLQFGGTTSSFPALKRSTTTLAVRLADDSADADLSAARLISTNIVRLKGYTVATLPTGTIGDTAYVTDATAPTYLGTLVGGGAINTPVFYNGTAWVSY